jgi:hypothetical protein
MAIPIWSQETRVGWHYIAPGKPAQSEWCLRTLQGAGPIFETGRHTVSRAAPYPSRFERRT